MRAGSHFGFPLNYIDNIHRESDSDSGITFHKMRYRIGWKRTDQGISHERRRKSQGKVDQF